MAVQEHTGCIHVSPEVPRTWITAHNKAKCCGQQHRTLVLCFDGTGEMFDEDSSNIVRFCSMLKNGDYKRQLVYYQSGVGTFYDPIGHNRIIPAKISLAFDQAIAWNLPSHVKDGYSFLMQNYKEGDKICLFGFSRGAYIARALAGMIQKIGLLPTHNTRQIPAAYHLYLRQDDVGLDLCYEFKRKFARSVPIEFIGLWDTVASVGLRPQQLPFISENTGVRTLRQALALDERRIKFMPQFCFDPPREDDTTERAAMGRAYEDLVDDSGAPTDVQEVWFAGVHTDVGGGAIQDNRLTKPSLARISLRWMIRQCFEANTGIVFDAAMLQAVGMPISKEQSVDQNGLSVETYKLDPVYEWSPVAVSPAASLSDDNYSIILDGYRTFLRAIGRSMTRVTKTLTREILPSFWPFSTFMPRRAKHPPRTPEQYEWRQHTADHEQVEEMKDMRAEIHCQLEDKPLWMALELIPLVVEQQTAVAHRLRHGKTYRVLWNRGRGRRIFHTGAKIKVHRTVKMRLENDPHYVPQARPELEVCSLYERDLAQHVPARRLSRLEWNQSYPTAWEWEPSSPRCNIPPK